MVIAACGASGSVVRWLFIQLSLAPGFHESCWPAHWCSTSLVHSPCLGGTDTAVSRWNGSIGFGNPVGAEGGPYACWNATAPGGALLSSKPRTPGYAPKEWSNERFL